MDKLNSLLEVQYALWKKENLDNKMYFIIFDTFLNEHLKNISGGALKLYVFLGMKSNPYKGSSWYSINTISNYFDVSERTVINWFNELIELKLIKRIKLNENPTNTTYLLPY